MNSVYDNAASECDQEEDVKDFLDRAEGDREFFRFMWGMRLSRLLAERGLRDITIKYDASTRQVAVFVGVGILQGEAAPPA